MLGLFYILLFWLIGNALSILTGGYVSGNIIGMILLFAALCMRWVKAETVRPAAKFLLGAMALFFVPYGVGLMDSYRVILDNLWAIVISGIVSTIVVLLVTGQTFQSLNRVRACGASGICAKPLQTLPTMIDKAFLSSDLFLLTLTVGLYCLGCAVYRRLRVPLLHPVLLTFVAVIVFLSAAGIDYPRYKQATSALDFALGMSVVALGYLLYEQVEQLRGSLLPVGVATLAGCVTGVLSVVYIAMAFGAGREILTSIAPKSVTVPIAVSVSGPLGGIVPITSVVVFCVGIFGSIFGEWILRRCGVRDAEARGFALGAAAHGIGTARAIEIGAVEGALSGLAMALMGLATALLMPLMERYLY